MAAKKLVNGVLIDMTPEEEAAFEAGRAPVLSDVKADAKVRIAAKRAAVEAAGVTVAGAFYATTGTDIARLAMLTNKQNNDPKKPSAAVLAAVADRIALCDDRQTALLALIDAAATVAAAQAVDITVGWPA